MKRRWNVRKQRSMRAWCIDRRLRGFVQLLVLAVCVFGAPNPAHAEDVVRVPLGSHVTSGEIAGGRFFVAVKGWTLRRPPREQSYLGELVDGGPLLTTPLPALNDGRMLKRPDGRRWVLVNQNRALLEQPDGTWIGQRTPVDVDQTAAAAVAPDGRLVLVENRQSVRVSLLDGVRAESRRVTQPDECYGPQADVRRDGTILITFAGCAVLISLPPAGGQTTTRLPFPSRGVVVAPDDGLWILAALDEEPRILRIGPDGAQRIIDLPGGTPPPTALGPAVDGTLWMTTGCDVLRLDAGGAVMQVHPVGFPARGVSAADDGRLLIIGDTTAVRGLPWALPTAGEQCDRAAPPIRKLHRGRITIRQLRRHGYSMILRESAVVTGSTWFRDRSGLRKGFHGYRQFEEVVQVPPGGGVRVDVLTSPRGYARAERLVKRGRPQILDGLLFVEDLAGNMTVVDVAERVRR